MRRMLQGQFRPMSDFEIRDDKLCDYEGYTLSMYEDPDATFRVYADHTPVDTVFFVVEGTRTWTWTLGATSAIRTV